MAQYELIYFPVRGRAEILRLVLEEAQIPYTQTNIGRDELMALKPQLAFGQVPALKNLATGELLVQSIPTAKLLASEHGLYPSDHHAAYEIDAIIAATDDFRMLAAKATPYFNATAEARKKFRDEDIPRWGAAFTAALEKGKFGTEHFTLADLAAYDVLGTVKALVPHAFDSFPAIAAFLERVEARPHIAAYRASDRSFPAMAPLADD